MLKTFKMLILGGLALGLTACASMPAKPASFTTVSGIVVTPATTTTTEPCCVIEEDQAQGPKKPDPES